LRVARFEVGGELEVGLDAGGFGFSEAHGAGVAAGIDEPSGMAIEDREG
jgi:hypothetical protein